MDFLRGKAKTEEMSPVVGVSDASMAEKESMCQDDHFLFGVWTVEITSLFSQLMMNGNVGKIPGVSANHIISNLKWTAKVLYNIAVIILLLCSCVIYYNLSAFRASVYDLIWISKQLCRIGIFAPFRKWGCDFFHIWGIIYWTDI